MKVSRNGKKLIFEFPTETPRYNPYVDEKDYVGTDITLGTYSTLVGLITKNDLGFAFTIDRAYKGKADDYTAIMIHWDSDEESFIKICKKIKIKVIHENNSSHSNY